jgi:hypothetical protein
MLGNNVFIPIADDFAVRPIAIIWNPRHSLGQAARDFLAYTLQTESDGEVPPVNSLRLG